MYYRGGFGAGPVPFPRFPRKCPDAAFRGAMPGRSAGRSGFRNPGRVRIRDGGGTVSAAAASPHRGAPHVSRTVAASRSSSAGMRSSVRTEGPPAAALLPDRTVPPASSRMPSSVWSRRFPIGPFAIRRKDRAIRVKSGRTTAEIRLRTCSFLGFVLILPEEISGR